MLTVKICGVRTLEDARLCIDAGADSIGINLHPGSKRFIALDQATHLLEEISGHIVRVAVVVNLSQAAVIKLWQSGLFEEVQLHGDEPAEYCRELVKLGVTVTKAMPLVSESTLTLMASYPQGMSFLLDAHVPGERGGTGKVINWQLARSVVEQFAAIRVVLSGGLNPENIAAAVRQVMPAGVDVASGVESAPGVKDPQKVCSFITQAKSAAGDLADTN